jgi:hypothetical protein
MNGTFEAGDTGFTRALARATSFAPSAYNMPGTRVTSANASGVVQSPGQSSAALHTLLLLRRRRARSGRW